MKNLTCCVLFVAIITGCAESLPDKSESKTTINRTHQSPILVFNEELEVGQVNNAIRIDDQLSVVINDTSNQLDSSAIRNNRSINARAQRNNTILTTGTSRITEQVFYELDAVVSYTLYEYDTNGLRTKRIHYNGPGIDSQWFTEDDSIKNYTLFDLQLNQRQVHSIYYINAGTDGIWFNEDDGIRYYLADVLDAAGNIVATGRFDSFGSDGIWFNADDNILSLTTETTLADGNMEWLQYVSSGVDLDWTTLDDNDIGHFSLAIVGTSGNTERHTFYINPGADGIRYTSDDLVGFYHDYRYDSNNALNQIITFSGGPGVDGTWFTGDDIAKSCDTRDYNADNTVNLVQSFDPGLDATCFSEDDVLSYYHDHTYDATGHLLGSNTFVGAGTDTQWFTSDDERIRSDTYVAN